LLGWLVGAGQRRIIVLRRRVKGALAASSPAEEGQPRLAFLDIGPGEEIWEYQILVTSLVEELGSFGQLYRDRADSETYFDELKNQWGWGGFVTQDLARCRLAARLVRCSMIGGTFSFVWPSRAVQRSLLKTIASTASRPPSAAAKRSCGIVSDWLQRRTL